MDSYPKTIGTLLVGIFFNTFLYGLVTYQFALYYKKQFNDQLAIKYMVLFLFILDTFHSASVIYMAWDYTVTNYNNPAALAVADWPHAFTPLGTAFAALTTQIYLGFRIWRLTRSKTLYGVVVMLAVTSFTLGMITSIKAWTIKVFSEFPKFTFFTASWLSTQVTVDIFITVTLVVVLSRSRTGLRKTDTILNRFIRGTIQTGLFAGIFAIGDLVTFILLPDANLYGMFGIPLGRIYTNTLMDTLLARELLQTATNCGQHASDMIDSVYWPPVDSQAMDMIDSTTIGLSGRSTQEMCDRLFSERAEDKVVALEV